MAPLRSVQAVRLFADRRAGHLQQQVQKLTLNLQMAEIDRDYYRAQRDRWKTRAELAEAILKPQEEAAKR